MSEWTVVEHDGKRWNRTKLPSGAIIESEIVEAHEHPEIETKEYKLLKEIATKLGIPGYEQSEG